LLGNPPPVPTGYEAWWTPELISSHPAHNFTNSSCISIDVILIPMHGSLLPLNRIITYLQQRLDSCTSDIKGYTCPPSEKLILSYVRIKMQLSLSNELTGPIMCAPSSLSVTLSARTFTNPSVSLLVLALLFAAKGNLPTLYSTP
jgi:hypothetical protein